MVHTGPLGYRYVDCPLLGGTVKIDRRRSISVVGGRLREKSIVDSRLREKKGRRREKKERSRRGEERSTSFSLCLPRPRAVVARGRFFSRSSRRNVSPRGEKDRGD
ncbi:hypothetical protein BHE74_00001248, partial [Ensete ventricosum]